MAKTKSKHKSRNNKTVKHKLSSKTILQEFVHTMLEAENTIRMFHWKTQSYSAHKTTDTLHETLSGLVDRYAETFMGKKDIKVNMKHMKPIKIKYLENTQSLEKYIKHLVQYTNKINNKLSHVENNDLHAIRDEIVSELNRSLYLLRFNKK